MKAFCWVFLITFFLDAMVSIVASLAPTLENVSNNISSLGAILAFVIFILALAGKAEPKKLFIAIPLFYLAGSVFTVFLVFAVVEKFGRGALEPIPTLAFFQKNFSWFIYAQWIGIAIATLLSIYGIYAFSKFQAGSPPSDELESGIKPPDTL